MYVVYTTLFSNRVYGLMINWQCLMCQKRTMSACRRYVTREKYCWELNCINSPWSWEQSHTNTNRMWSFTTITCIFKADIEHIAVHWITVHSDLQNSKFLLSQVPLNVKSWLQQELRILDRLVLRYMDWLSSFWCQPLYCLYKILKITKLFILHFEMYLEWDQSKNLIFSVHFRTEWDNM